MNEILRCRSVLSCFLLLSLLVSLQFISVISNDSAGSKNGTKEAEPHASSSSKTRSEVLIILLVLVVVGFLSFFLFKLWQKKKREEQHAQLLKLFEEDDELEVELGLRD